MKVINSSGQMIGLLIRDDKGQLVQRNVMLDDYIVVDQITSQMYNLADPERGQIIVKEEEEDE